MITARRILPILVALVLFWPLPAHAGGGDDASIAINTRDGSQVFRFSFNVRRVMGDVVDTSNAAVAYASCESCETVAVAIQLVLVSGEPSVVTPQNLAIAINEGCDACETLASAYQFVLGVGDGPARFTPEGRRVLAELRRELAQLKHSDLSIDDVQTRVEAIVGRLRDVIANELVIRVREDAAGGGGDVTESTGQTESTETQPTEAERTGTDETSTGPTTTSPPTDTTLSNTTTAEPTTQTTTVP